LREWLNNDRSSLRHQAITYLTRHIGLAYADLQLIKGHARRDASDLPACGTRCGSAEEIRRVIKGAVT
jgi:hypothetical protein